MKTEPSLEQEKIWTIFRLVRGVGTKLRFENINIGSHEHVVQHPQYFFYVQLVQCQSIFVRSSLHSPNFGELSRRTLSEHSELRIQNSEHEHQQKDKHRNGRSSSYLLNETLQ